MFNKTSIKESIWFECFPLYKGQKSKAENHGRRGRGVFRYTYDGNIYRNGGIRLYHNRNGRYPTGISDHVIKSGDSGLYDLQSRKYDLSAECL